LLVIFLPFKVAIQYRAHAFGLLPG